MTAALHSFAPASQPHRFPHFRRFLNRLQALSSLSPLSDAHLRDIGLTRADIQALRDLPLSADAATRLHITASRRSGNW